MMQGRVENCIIAKGSQLIVEAGAEPQKDNISFIDFNSLQVFGTGRDSYVFHNSPTAKSVLAATKSALSLSEMQL